ncbi:3-oxoacyl-ACP reductase family protein [Halalkalibacter alkalisediminis]|uniref:3-oxoacyl-ACP reductase family protein n=1 Tax=Halalkalibacter alkalisediminis TaxID=935616 RepID=A0ABV6NL54_9BACI|nr:3-oxoacyl-ACP reductase family protein [Halalkalibacter alkalisediminis]
MVLITGGSKGIGEGIVRDFAARGWSAHFTYHNSHEKAECLEREFSNVYAHHADVTDYQTAKAIVKEVTNQHGKIDCLINNAGITKDKTIGFMNESNWRDVIETNLTGNFNYSKFVSKQMMKQKSGSIINIASISGMIGIPGQANYSASKAGIITLTRTMAKELGPFNIKVNVVSPGFIETSMTEGVNYQDMLEGAPLKRVGQIGDITGVVHFLTSSEADYITGQNFVVDGGLSI